ncbi:helix-turn-helix domain-containing protein [Flavobacterium sp. 25HG05S-40]|uniref:helix-turn-helix domain-containing protein n=1 Tax=Flavobacterium sp. 25HG05S-40 TaxID=3458682 RepID=UPI00404436C4
MITLKLCLLFTIVFFCSLYSFYSIFTVTQKSKKKFLTFVFISFLIINCIEAIFYFPELKSKIASTLGFLFYQKETFELLILPCVALYVEKKLIKHLWLHFLPAISSLLFAIIYFGVNGSDSIIAAKCHWYIWSNPIGYLFISIQLAQVLFYPYYFYRKFFNKINLVEMAGKNFKFLLFKTITLCKVLFLLDFFLAVYFHDHLAIQVPIYFSYKLIFLISVSALFLAEIKNSFVDTAIKQLTIKYSGNRLSEERKQVIFTKIKNFMDEDKPYLDQNFSLEILSENLNILRTNISMVINEKCKMNFREFVNSYRINESLRLMSDTDYYSINQIYFEAGFNSKSVFNTTFKKQIGVTPTEYRKTLYLNDAG